MKRIILSVFMLTALSSIGNKINAQTKIGYFDENTVLGLMPGIQKVDTLLNQFNQDSLQGEYEYTLGEFKRKDDLLKADSTAATKLSGGQKKIIQGERDRLAYQLTNWNTYTQQKLGAKQRELVAPFMDKIRIAFQKVIARDKFSYVLRAENLYFAPPENDLVPLVCKELGIKLPPAYFGQQSGDGNNAPKPAKH